MAIYEWPLCNAIFPPLREMLGWPGYHQPNQLFAWMSTDIPTLCAEVFSLWRPYNITFISILFPFFLKFQPPKLRTQLYPGICSAQISLTTLSHVSLFYNKVSTIKMFSKYWVHVFSAAEHFLRTLTAVYDCPIDGLTFCLITLSAGMALLSLCIS